MSEVENKRTPRPLVGTDIFLMTSIVGKIGVRNIMNSLETPEAKAARESGDPEQIERLGQFVFFGVIDVLLERLEYCEDSICKLLSKLYGMTVNDIKALGAAEYLDMLLAVVQDENFVDFFKQAYASVKRMM